jgi:hypothetical protein
MTQRKWRMMLYCGMLILAAASLNLMYPASVRAQTEGPGTVCVLQVAATADVMAVVVDDVDNVDMVVLVPRDNITNLPIRCVDLGRLGLAVANQEPFKVQFNTTIYDNQGNVKCTKGPFNLPANGGQGVSFKDCV